jgi:hypothetical protein
MLVVCLIFFLCGVVCLQADITGLQNLAKQALLAAAEAKSNGVTDDQYAGLHHVLKLANERWKGLRHLPEFGAVRALLRRFDTECEAVLRLEQALSVGGWLNSGVPNGCYDEYQPADSMEVELLYSALMQCHTVATVNAAAQGTVGGSAPATTTNAAANGTSNGPRPSIARTPSAAAAAAESQLLSNPLHPEASMYTHKGKVTVRLGWALYALRAAVYRVLGGAGANGSSSAAPSPRPSISLASPSPRASLAVGRPSVSSAALGLLDPVRLQDFKLWREVESTLTTHGAVFSVDALLRAALNAATASTTNPLSATDALLLVPSAADTANATGTGAGGEEDGSTKPPATPTTVSSPTGAAAAGSASGTGSKTAAEALDAVVSKALTRYQKCGEVVTAVREVQFQYAVRAINERLRSALTKTDLNTLRTLIEAAQKLGMRPQYNPAVTPSSSSTNRAPFERLLTDY